LFGDRALDFLESQTLGWFLTLAILPEYRQKKLGWNLASEQKNWLKSQGCTALVGSSWVSGSKDNSTYMFERAGFEKLGESQEFLRNQFRVAGAECGCGQKNCECKSVLYGMRIRE
jgi:hypothetical protein